jgi:mannose-6-phosphate isomerase-like protein (cupin superfamily)
MSGKQQSDPLTSPIAFAVRDVEQLAPVEAYDFADARFLFVMAQAGIFYTRVMPRSTMPSHVHEGCHQFSFIVRGRGTIEIPNRRLDVRPGLCVQIPAGTPHAWHNPFDHMLEYLELKVPREGAPDMIEYLRRLFPQHDNQTLAIHHGD